ncbi:MAG: hypothetical protein NWE92_05370 [Candidatus Bathyarchaeota archaeon]|nr:hypothetical protein [Candidatus Bathyarchaeota archaeon]
MAVCSSLLMPSASAQHILGYPRDTDIEENFQYILPHYTVNYTIKTTDAPWDPIYPDADGKVYQLFVYGPPPFPIEINYYDKGQQSAVLTMDYVSLSISCKSYPTNITMKQIGNDPPRPTKSPVPTLPPGRFTYTLPDQLVRYDIVKIGSPPAVDSDCQYNIMVYGPNAFDIQVSFKEQPEFGEERSRSTVVHACGISTTIISASYPTEFVMTQLSSSTTRDSPTASTSPAVSSTPFTDTPTTKVQISSRPPIQNWPIIILIAMAIFGIGLMVGVDIMRRRELSNKTAM